MTEADKTQHGGEHYRSEYQHWNLVADLGLNYYVANATKYMTRHGDKNGREDVVKAGHYIDKYVELIKEGRMPAPLKVPHLAQLARDELLIKFFDANEIDDALEQAFFLHTAGASEVADLALARDAAHKIANRYDKMTDWKCNDPGSFTKLPSDKLVPVDLAAVMEPNFAPEGYWGDNRILWKCKPCGAYFQGQDGVLPSTLHACPADPAEPTPAYVNQDR